MVSLLVLSGYLKYHKKHLVAYLDDKTFKIMLFHLTQKGVKMGHFAAYFGVLSLSYAGGA